MNRRAQMAFGGVLLVLALIGLGTIGAWFHDLAVGEQPVPSALASVVFENDEERDAWVTFLSSNPKCCAVGVRVREADEFILDLRRRARRGP